MEIDLLVEDSRWDAFGLPRLAQDALSNVFEHLSIDEDVVEVSILACDDARIAALNADFREKPTPTNVLSWPSDDLGASKAGALPQAPVADLDGQLALGDIAISYDTCFREAQEQDKQFEHHVAHLLVHGTLHLLGYDHLRDSDATLMERIESKILGKMGIDDPYRD